MIHWLLPGEQEPQCPSRSPSTRRIPPATSTAAAWIAEAHAAWHAEAAPDLFGTWLVQTRYGRIGTEGRRLARSFPSEEAARAYLTRLLRRRATAPARLGVPYREIPGR